MKIQLLIFLQFFWGFLCLGQGLTSQKTISSGGTNRNYYLSLPVSEVEVDDNLPIVFVLHGQNGTGNGIANSTGFAQKSIENNFIGVYPNAIGGVWDKNVFDNYTTDDLTFFLDLIELLKTEFHIDESRIFATGMSDGAAMVYRIAAEAPAIFKAVAPVAGLLQLNGYQWWEYGFGEEFIPIPILHIHGINDNGTSTAYPDPDHVPNDWEEYPLFSFSAPTCNNYTYDPQTVSYPYVGVREMKFCEGENSIRLLGIEGLGHTWPNLSNSNYNATSEIISFFGLDQIIEPPIDQGNAMYVDGRYLYDACGERVELRGANVGSVYYGSSDWGIPQISEVEKTGANSVRIVLEKKYKVWWPTEQTLNTEPEDVEAIIQACLTNNMIPVLELHDYTGSQNPEADLLDAAAWWTDEDMLNMLLQYEDYLIINIANEPSSSVNINDANKLIYYNANKAALQVLRNAGYSCPIMIDGLHYGKDHTFFLDYGDQLLADDPLGNLLFSVHLYWPTPDSGYGWNWSDQKITNDFQDMYDSELPFIFGEVASYVVEEQQPWCSTYTNYPINYELILELSEQMGFGWYAWWWTSSCDSNPLNMTNTGLYENLFSHGEAMAVTSPNSIQNTSVRPSKLVTGECMVTWTGTEWLGVPGADKNVLIDGPITIGVDVVDLEVANLNVSENGDVEVEEGQSLKVNGKIINQANAENFELKVGSNLIQTSQDENEGEITIYQSSQPMKRLDYTLWSSPVIGQQIKEFSPQTLPNRFYSYEGENGYVAVPNVLADFEIGKGYLIRAPNNWNPTIATPFNGIFKGIPANGEFSFPTYVENYTSLGNPYPSTLNADSFLLANPNILTLYFWTNSNAYENGAYSGYNYATYTLAGGVAAENGVNIPDGNISVGQGFLVYSESPNALFSNDMRSSSNGIFFKNSNVEIDRFWLNLSDTKGNVINQILIAYLDGATQGFDSQIDGEILEYDGPLLFSSINEKKYSIQGRSLPFEKSDRVLVGFKTNQKGVFRISLANVEGLFKQNDMDIYIYDTLTRSVQNLQHGSYDFESLPGEFMKRFEVFYVRNESSTTLKEIANSEVLIYKHENNLVVDTGEKLIESIEIYNLSGRKIFGKSGISENQFFIGLNNFDSNIYVVKVKIVMEGILTKKIKI